MRFCIKYSIANELQEKSGEANTENFEYQKDKDRTHRRQKLSDLAESRAIMEVKRIIESPVQDNRDAKILLV